MKVREFAPAKINLSLEVGPPGAYGRHPLQSAVAFADVGDIVEASSAPELSLSLAGPFSGELDSDDNNLVLRAARALAAAASIPNAGAQLRLTKNLPVASGIGGGSSDAAAALRALNRLWKLGWGASQLREAAQGLGADVPVCIEALPAWMTGTGETSQPLALPAFDAVLVNPRRALSTAAVYREFDALALGARFARRDPPKWAGRELCLSDLAAWGNDLEAPAQRLTPELFAVRAALARRDPRLTGLSGSGATMFAIVESADGARALAAALALAHPDWWIQPVQLGEL